MMKTIEELANVEKAKLLHQLFPSEIPALLKFVQGVCATIKEDEQAQREQWKNGIYSFDFWLSLVNEVEQKIGQYNGKLHQSSTLFADQLFDGYCAMYMAHCLITYTTKRQHPNQKFTIAVDLLFA